MYKRQSQYPDLHIDIFAHVFESGKDQTNLGVSVLRANEIKNALTILGINQDRIHAKGVGDQFPRKRKDLKAGKKNERIEVYLYNPLP